MAEWFHIKNGVQNGPYSSRDLKQLAVSGELLPTDLVQRSDQQKQILAGRVSGLFSPKHTGKTVTSPAAVPGASSKQVSTGMAKSRVALVGTVIVGCIILSVYLFIVLTINSSPNPESVTTSSGVAAFPTSNTVGDNTAGESSSEGTPNHTDDIGDKLVHFVASPQTNSRLQFFSNDSIQLASDGRFLIQDGNKLFELRSDVFHLLRTGRVEVSPDESIVAYFSGTRSPDGASKSTLDLELQPLRMADVPGNAISLTAEFPYHQEVFRGSSGTFWCDNSTLVYHSPLAAAVIDTKQDKPKALIVSHPLLRLPQKASEISENGGNWHTIFNPWLISSVDVSASINTIVVGFLNHDVICFDSITGKRKAGPTLVPIGNSENASYEGVKLKVSPNAEYLAIKQNSDKDVVELWNTADWKKAYDITPKDVGSPFDNDSLSFIRFLPGTPTRLLLFSVPGQYLTVWDVKGRKAEKTVRAITGTASKEKIVSGHTVHVSPDGIYVLFEGPRLMQVWNIEYNQCIAVIDKQVDKPSKSTVSAGGAYVAVNSNDGRLRIWNTAKGESIPFSSLAVLTIRPDLHQEAKPVTQQQIDKLSYGMKFPDVVETLGGMPFKSEGEYTLQKSQPGTRLKGTGMVGEFRKFYYMQAQPDVVLVLGFEGSVPLKLVKLGTLGVSLTNSYTPLRLTGGAH